MPVKVRVLGKSYQVSCPSGEEARVHQAAALLEGKITELRGRGVGFSAENLALITGLNLAHELLSTEDKLRALDDTADALGFLCSRLDQVIDEAKAPLNGASMASLTPEAMTEDA